MGRRGGGGDGDGCRPSLSWVSVWEGGGGRRRLQAISILGKCMGRRGGGGTETAAGHFYPGKFL